MNDETKKVYLVSYDNSNFEMTENYYSACKHYDFAIRSQNQEYDHLINLMGTKIVEERVRRDDNVYILQYVEIPIDWDIYNMHEEINEMFCNMGNHMLSISSKEIYELFLAERNSGDELEETEII